MAVYCYVNDCVFRSKRKAIKKNVAGENTYRCTLTHIWINDWDDEAYNANEKNISCGCYKRDNSYKEIVCSEIDDL